MELTRLVSFAAVTVVSTAAVAAGPACDSGISLPLMRERTGHVSAAISVNGMPVRFLVDTGANVSTLDTQAALRLKATVTGGEGEKPGEGRTSLTVGAGTVALGEQPFAVMNLDFINMPSKRYGTEPFAGQLGSAFFAAFSASIDYGSMSLCLRPAGRASPKP